MGKIKRLLDEQEYLMDFVTEQELQQEYEEFKKSMVTLIKLMMSWNYIE